MTAQLPCTTAELVLGILNVVQVVMLAHMANRSGNRRRADAARRRRT